MSVHSDPKWQNKSVLRGRKTKDQEIMEDEFVHRKNHEASEVTLTVHRLRSSLTYCSPVEIYMHDAICIYCIAFSEEKSHISKHHASVGYCSIMYYCIIYFIIQ